MSNDGIKYADILCRYYGNRVRMSTGDNHITGIQNTYGYALSEADTEAIEQMLENLSEEDRQVFKLKYVDRLTYVQIEGRVPMSSSTAQRRVTAMLKILAKQLSRH